MVSDKVATGALGSGSTVSGLAGAAHWLPRIGLASIFLFHGATKLAQPQGLAQMMGMPAALIVMVGMMELVGGVLVLAGGWLAPWATRIGALLLAAVMAGAVALVHWGQWAFAASPSHPMGGMEFQVFTILVLAWLALTARRERTS